MRTTHALQGLGLGTRELLLGGHSVGEAALVRFYVLHVAVLPSLVILLTIVHFWRVRKDGGISGPLPVMLEA